MYRVDLTLQTEEALAELPERALLEIMEVIASVLVRPESWPPPDGWNTALQFGASSWVQFVRYRDGIDVVDVGWAG